MTTKHHFRFFIISIGTLGILYPLTTGGLGQFLFPYQANGSLLFLEGKAFGSDLIGQTFKGDQYLHARPTHAEQATDKSEMEQPTKSGCEPWISYKAAKSQLMRISKARSLDIKTLEKLLFINRVSQTFGEDLVHVLAFNVKLDQMKK